MKRRFATVGVLCVANVVSCHRHSAPKENRTPISILRIGSSDTLIQLTAAWAEVYDDSHQSLAVTTAGGGSGTAIAGLLNGSIHVAATIRKLNEAEERKFMATHGRLPKRTLIGYEAAAVCVHKDNPVSSVSLEDLRGIFAQGGRIGDWARLGASDLGPIMRLRVSGMLEGNTVFYQAVFGTGKGDFSHSSSVAGSSELLEACATHRGGIGWLGPGWTTTDRVNWLRVTGEKGGVAVDASEANVRSGRYPITRPIALYSMAGAPDEVEAFVVFALSPQGQSILAKEGFVTVSE